MSTSCRWFFCRIDCGLLEPHDKVVKRVRRRDATRRSLLRAWLNRKVRSSLSLQPSQGSTNYIFLRLTDHF